MSSIYPSTAPFSATTTSGSPFSNNAWHGVSWPAIFAGLVAAIALQILFMLLGAGLGFALYHPLTEDNPVADLGKGAVIIQGISAVVSLWFGGWVAGRLAPAALRANGWLHGFCVWTSATVAGVIVVSTGAGWALGDISKLVGGGLSLAGRPAAAATGGLAELAKNSAKQSSDTLASFTEESLGRLPAGSPQNTSVRAKREIGMAVARLFAPAREGNTAESRAAVVKTLTEQTGISEQDANQMVTDWTATYDRMKSELNNAKAVAETKARETAEAAANTLAVFSFCAFAAFALGAVSASMGGVNGANHSVKAADPAGTPSIPTADYTIKGQRI